MGGIAIDPGGSSPFIPNSECLTFTPSGVSFLLKHEPQLLPDIPEAEVKDKSKGGSFTKFVACIQATWFCLSCIGRLAQKKPISMLELNTFAHAFCTVIVYIIVRSLSLRNLPDLCRDIYTDPEQFQWWRKPLDIERPLIVREDRMRRLLAYMWMASKTSCIPKPPRPSGSNSSICVGRDPEFEAIVDDKASGADVATGSEALNARQRASLTVSPAATLTNTEDVSIPIPGIVLVTTTQGLPGTGFRVNGESTRWREDTSWTTGQGLEATVHHHTSYKPAVFTLKPRDVRRWQLAREAMDKYHLRKPNKNLDLVTIKPVPESMGSNDPDDNPMDWASLGFLLVAAGYGVLHALAWYAHFPTHRELKLWRISALIIICPAALILLSILLRYITIFTRTILRLCYYKIARDPKTNSTEKSLPQPAVVTDKPSAQRTTSSVENTISTGTLISSSLCDSIIVPLLGVSVIFLYIPARGYLVYESLRTVFFLPPEAYSATWTQYLPHIT